MEDLLKGQQIHYFDCDKGGLHEGECLNLICLDQKCKDKKLLCSVCLQEFHEDHQDNILPLKKFLGLLNQQIQNNTVKQINSDEILEKLESLLQTNLYNLKASVLSLSEDIKSLEKSLQQSYKQVKQRILSQSLMSSTMPEVIQNLLNGEFASNNKLQESCENLINSIKYKANNIQLDFNPQKVYQNYDNATKIYEKNLLNLQSSFQQQFSQIKKILENNETTECFTFSNTKKSSTINITEKGRIATQTQESEKRYVLSEQSLSLTTPTFVAFKVNKLSSWIGVGICLDSILGQKNYSFNQYTNVGHGGWLISSNNYKWSNCTKSQNQKCEGFNFVTGDILLMKFDPKVKLLSFKNKTSTKTAQLTVNLQPDQNQVYACANLCQKNEQVELIDWKPEDEF